MQTDTQSANAGQLAVGNAVTYYCLSQMAMREGVITAVDVPVEWLWVWRERGTTMQSPHPTPGAKHPLGVQINGSLTRAYYGDDKSRVQA